MKRDLNTLLKSADPAAGDPGLSRAEAARMKNAILEETERASRGHGWIPLLAGGALAALVLLIALLAPLPEGIRAPRGGGSAEAGRAGTLRDPAGRSTSHPGVREVRQPRRIHFTTRSGTRVIWTLDPDYDV